MKELILGGARSGKSRLAESRALQSPKKCIYIATGTAEDEEMERRIAAHKKRRGEHWRLIEEPLRLADVLRETDDSNSAIVVDCLTLWLSNCLHHGDFEREKTQLINTIPSMRGDIFMVSNQTGSGIVPLGKLSRQFVDYSGWLHQELAQICDRVTLVVAGLPLSLKEEHAA